MTDHESINLVTFTLSSVYDGCYWTLTYRIQVVDSVLSAIGHSVGDAIVAGASDLYKLTKDAIKQISSFNPVPLFDGIVMAVTFVTGQVRH